MIDELRELFAKLYAVGCEHDNYAYALSDELNAEVDKAMLKAFRSDLENLISRCEIVSKTEKYALDQMRGRIPARPFIWYKLHRVPNAAATAIENALGKWTSGFVKGAVAQTAQIESEIRAAQSGEREEPEVEPSETPEEAAEMPQDVPQEAAPGEGAEAAEKPENGNESAAELWDEEEADEDEEAVGDAE